MDFFAQNEDDKYSPRRLHKYALTTLRAFARTLSVGQQFHFSWSRRDDPRRTIRDWWCTVTAKDSETTLRFRSDDAPGEADKEWNFPSFRSSDLKHFTGIMHTCTEDDLELNYYKCEQGPTETDNPFGAEFGANALREWKHSERKYHISMTAVYTARSLQKAMEGVGRMPDIPTAEDYDHRVPAKVWTPSERKEWQERMYEARHVHGAHYLKDVLRYEATKEPLIRKFDVPDHNVAQMTKKDRERYQNEMYNAKHVHGAHYMDVQNKQLSSKKIGPPAVRLRSTYRRMRQLAMFNAKHVHGAHTIPTRPPKAKRNQSTPRPAAAFRSCTLQSLAEFC